MANKKTEEGEVRSEAARILGRLGGLARAAKLSDKELTEQGKKASNSRWDAYRKKKKEEVAREEDVST